ncbi:MAG: GNAT family N-acetyltransferase [Bacteroidetes bacterium]|nr:GNAT family N-acetyltransferase [Bacteroidota bacterium]
MNFRHSTISDIPFITKAILESEKSGTETLSWSRILDLKEEDVSQLIQQILEEEIEGQEWNPNGFLIAEENGKPAAALSAWIENTGGMSSGMIKAQSIAFMVPEKWKGAAEKLQMVSSVQIPRISGALQLENIYVDPEFRGRKLAAQLIEFAISEYQKTNPEIELAEIQLMGNNIPALRSYTNCGFLKAAESPVSNDLILNLLPGTFKVSLQRKISHGQSGNPQSTI